MINGITQIALTKLDVLTGFDKINVCIGYDLHGKRVDEICQSKLNSIKPLFIEIDGWKENISKCRSFDELPVNTQNYIKFLEDELEVPVSYVSVGPGRESTFRR